MAWLSVPGITAALAREERDMGQFLCMAFKSDSAGLPGLSFLSFFSPLASLPQTPCPSRSDVPDPSGGIPWPCLCLSLFPPPIPLATSLLISLTACNGHSQCSTTEIRSVGNFPGFHILTCKLIICVHPLQC